jgi:lipoate-protein ligase A
MPNIEPGPNSVCQQQLAVGMVALTMNSLRLLPFASADGSHNMAADEVLLQTALTGAASLRFYGWSQPTVSLGYFQSAQVRFESADLASLPFVRRPSGGAMLVHHHELTYALALPPGPSWQAGSSWPVRMHQIIATALRRLGVVTHSYEEVGTAPAKGALCFHQFAIGDLRIGGAKIAGSAQRRQHGALLQHGAILLAQSDRTPSLEGIAEQSGVSLTPEGLAQHVTAAFAATTGWAITPDLWTESELDSIERLVQERYARDTWNAKR